MPGSGTLACTSTRPISHARPTGAGGCSPIARRRRRAQAMRWRTARSSSRCCRSRYATSACAAFAASSASCVRSMLSHADDGERPLAVMLTPGPFNETYFEHAYLSRQLGLPLVEGQDLTVRGDTVYLKTLGGLRRVHAILRRLDDDYCDPAELRSDSALGVPGLIGRARRTRRARQCARYRRARIRCMARLPARRLRTAARREAGAAVRGDVVVR